MDGAGTSVTTDFRDAITTVEGLRELYRDPGARGKAKEVDHLDANCVAFLAHSTFVMVATADGEGHHDNSPRGGPPGFVKALDARRLAIPDLSGNNRLDTLQNIVRTGGIGLLFMVPGIDETLRVNGRATVTTDPEVLAACVVEGRVPRVAVGVTVDSAYIHCAKALRRGGLWDSASWPDTADMPTIACMIRDHVELPDIDPALIEADLEANYAKTMWLPGGDTPPDAPT